MPEEGNMSFKVYLDMGGGKQEVRRFGLPENVATNYTVLKDKICSIFGLNVQKAILSWKDMEGDSITISSDDELMEAVVDSVSKQNLQLVRIYVTEENRRPDCGPSGPSAPSGPQGNQEGDIHPGVTCDVCNERIQGFRYKCVTCPDFDLCGNCEAKGHHKEHRMMRLSKPQDAGGPWFFWKENEDPPGHFSTHFGMHNKDGGGGFASSASFCGNAGVGGAGAWRGFGGPWGRQCHRRGHGGRGRGNWGGWWPRGWGGKNWGGCAQSQTMDSGCGNQQQQQQSQQQQSQQQHSQQQQSQQQQNSGGCSNDNCTYESGQPNTCPFNGQDSEMPTPEQFAEQMARQAAHHFASSQVANVMRDIWTAWSGQQDQNTNTSSTSQSHSHSTSSSSGPQQDASAEQKKNNDTGERRRSDGDAFLKSVGETVANLLDPLGINVEVDVEHDGIRQRCHVGETAAGNAQNNTPPRSSSPRQPGSSAASVVSGGSVNMEVQTDSASGVHELDKDADIMEVTSPAPQKPNQEGTEDKSGSPDPEDWMVVNQEGQNEAAAAPPEAAPKPATSQKVNYPSLAELTPHPDPKIQRALELMAAMGYSNDGGWLTNLVEMKQGDINQVLDLLQPVSK